MKRRRIYMKKKRWIPLLFSVAVALLLLSFIFFTFFQINFRPSFSPHDTPMGDMMESRNGMNRETNTVELKAPEQPSSKLHLPTLLRSEERRVGKECRTWTSRHY